MKICYIAGYYAHSNDGIGRYSSNLISEISRINTSAQITVIGEGKNHSQHNTPPKKAILPPWISRILRPLEMEYHYFNRFHRSQHVWVDKLQPIEADIFHAISPSEAPAPALLKKKPLVTTIHDLIPLISKSRYIFEKYYFKNYCHLAAKSDLIIADSEHTKEDICSLLGVTSKKIVVVYPGINTQTFTPKKRITKKSNKKTIIYLGGLVERKGVYETLKAFNKLAQQRNDIHLKVYGGGEEEYRLKKFISQLDTCNQISLEGFVPDSLLPEIYRSADLFIYPTKYEGFGYTPLEAMACGVPVITSNTSSIPEVVGKGAITVSPENTDELAFQMNKILNDEKLQNDLQTFGPQIAKQYCLKKCAEETYKVYKQLL